MKYVETLEEFEAILKGAEDKLVAVDFTATWCPPCKIIGPKFEEMVPIFNKKGKKEKEEEEEEEEEEKVIFLKVDVDEGDEIAQKYGVSAMPTFMFFKNAKKVDELVGADEKKLLEKLNAWSSSSSPTDQSTKSH